MKSPIRPEEVARRKLEHIPDSVIEAFNDTIAAHWDGTSAMFTQETVVSLLVARGIIAYEEEAFSGHLLDVEPIYREAGWDVTYDKPGFNESYPATFTFARRS